MASLRFFFGTMGSGKSTMALQINHNLAVNGAGILLTQHDREGASVSSALGVSASAGEVYPGLDLFDVADGHRREQGALEYVVCDEAQFYEIGQVDQLVRVVDELGADVYAFGLITDFRGRLFPATAHLLEVADQREEIQVQARCWCGSPATHNARCVDGVQVYEGDLVVIDDGQSVTYELKCRRHWGNGQGDPSVAEVTGEHALV